MRARQYTPEELEALLREQVEAGVPLVLRIWEQMRREHDAVAERKGDAVEKTRAS